MSITNNNVQRNANISLILNRVWHHPGISRADIARELGMYKSTVSNIVGLLMDEGFIYEAEEGEAQPQGGRKPIILRLRPERACSLGIELQPAFWRAVVLDLAGEMLLEKSGRAGGSNPKDILHGAMEELEPALAGLGMTLLGAGVALPGIVPPREGEPAGSPAFDASMLVMDQGLKAAYTVPLAFMSDAAAGAWCQRVRADRRDLRTFAYLLVARHGGDPLTGTGRGMRAALGIVIDGRAFMGAHGGAGEIAMALRGQAGPGKAAAGQGVAAAALDDRSAFLDYLEELMRNLVPILAALDPEALIVGGELSTEADIDRVIGERLKESYYRSGRCLWPIEFSPFGYLDVARGAAAMSIRRLIAAPEVSADGEAMPLDWDELFARLRAKGAGLLRKSA